MLLESIRLTEGKELQSTSCTRIISPLIRCIPTKESAFNFFLSLILPNEQTDKYELVSGLLSGFFNYGDLKLFSFLVLQASLLVSLILS